MALVSCSECGRDVSELAHACPNCGNPNQTPRSNETKYSNVTPRPRSKAIAVVLAIFLGIFGAHKFYMGSLKLGILYLLFSWTTIPFYLGLIDAVVLAIRDPSYFANGVSSSSGAKPLSSDDYSWRPSSPGYVPTGNEKRNRLITGIVAVGIVALILVVGSLQNSSDRVANPSVGKTSNSKASSKPSLKVSSPSSATSDQACSAMKSADMAVATLGKKVISGTAKSSDTGSVKSALTRVNAAYPQLDGSFYFYLVGQGNAMDLLIRSVESGDFYSAGVAVQSYLDGDKYSTYCR